MECKNCRFVMRRGDYYFCHRFPPEYAEEYDRDTARMDPLTVWPVVDGSDWCGEHKPILTTDK